MSRTKATRPVPAVALTRPEAAAAVGMSVDSFDRYVAGHVRCIRCGSMRLYPVAELERWADEKAEGVFERVS